MPNEHEIRLRVTQISTSCSVMHYRSIICYYKIKEPKTFIYSFKYILYLCIELCASHCDLRLPYWVQTGTMHMAAVTTVCDAIYYGRVCTWYLALRLIPTNSQLKFWVMKKDILPFLISVDLILKQNSKYSDRTLGMSYFIDFFIEISEYNRIEEL